MTAARCTAATRFYYVPDGRLVVQPGMDGQTTTWLKAQVRSAGCSSGSRRSCGRFPHRSSSTSRSTGSSRRILSRICRLYSIGSEAKTYPTDTRSVQIVLETTHRTPWSDGNNLVVYPGSNLLMRDGEIVSIPGDVADRAANGESLAVGGGLPWALIAAAGVVVALLGVAILRMRPRVASRPVPQAYV